MSVLLAPYINSGWFVLMPIPNPPQLPPQLNLAGRNYLAMSQLACSLVSVRLITELQLGLGTLPAAEAEQRAVEVITTAINRVQPKFDGFLNDVRFADVPDQNRHSLIVRARVSGLNKVFAEISRELKLSVPAQPAHVTLYIAEGAFVVPVVSETDYRHSTTPLSEAAGDQLSKQLDPYRTFTWSRYMSPAPVRNNLILEFHVPSFAPERDFYAQFGFEQIDYDPISGGGTSDLGYFEIKREDSLGRTQLNFYGDKDSVAKHARFNEFPPDTPRGYAVEVTIPVDDVEDLWARVGSRLPKKQISQPLEIKRWGKCDFRVVDPFGFYIRFTEPVDWRQDV